MQGNMAFKKNKVDLHMCTWKVFQNISTEEKIKVPKNVHSGMIIQNAHLFT